MLASCVMPLFIDFLYRIKVRHLDCRLDLRLQFALKMEKLINLLDCQTLSCPGVSNNALLADHVEMRSVDPGAGTETDLLSESLIYSGRRHTNKSREWP